MKTPEASVPSDVKKTNLVGKTSVHLQEHHLPLCSPYLFQWPAMSIATAIQVRLSATPRLIATSIGT
jgi:hypothetical protein